MEYGEGHGLAPFPKWRPRLDGVAYLDAERWLVQLRDSSAPLLLPGSAEAAPLPLLAAAATQGAGAGGADGRAPADSVFFVGGPVWALEWCPWAGAVEPDVQHLAVAPRTHARETNVIGQPVGGPALLQLWEVPRPSSGGGGAGDGANRGLPRMALGLAFPDGGVVWEVKWCPSAACGLPAADGCLPRLGLLAVALGSGAVQVLAVPHPGALAARQPPAGTPQQPASAGANGASGAHGQTNGSAAGAGTRVGPPAGDPEGAGTPAIVELRPVALAAPGSLGSGLPSSVEWLPGDPHDRLLAACWDGSAAVWRLDPDAPAGAAPAALTLLVRFRADAAPLRAAVWVPREAALEMGTAMDPGRHLALTAGHAGSLKFWDVGEFEPELEVPGTMSWIMCAAWLAQPLGVVAGQDHGVLRFFAIALPDKHAKSAVNTIQGTNAGPIWSVTAREGLAPGSALVAYCGTDGDVAVCSLPPEARDRKAHVPVACLRQRGQALAVLPDAQLASEAGTFRPDKQGKAFAARMSDELEPLHRVRWSWQPHGPPASSVDGKRACGSKLLSQQPHLALSDRAWLAHGGAAGIVRCQRRDAVAAPAPRKR